MRVVHIMSKLYRNQFSSKKRAFRAEWLYDVGGTQCL